MSRRDFCKAAAILPFSFLQGDPAKANPNPFAFTGFFPVFGLAAQQHEVINPVEVPISKVIEGIETYGDDKPLTQQELDILRLKLNNEFAAGQTPMDPQTIYITELVFPRDYADIPIHMEESYQRFLTRHTEELDRMLKEASPDLGGIRMRRLIVVNEDVCISGSWHNGWIDGGLTDSDGAEGLWFHYPYVPTQSGYFDSAARLDRGRNHETFHSIHGPDIYPLEADFTSTGVANLSPEGLKHVLQEQHHLVQHVPQLADRATIYGVQSQLDSVEGGRALTVNSSSPAFNGIGNPKWQKYYLNSRKDGRNGLMGGGNMNRLCTYTGELFARRVRNGWSHDFVRTIPEGGWSYPHEVAANNILRLGSQFNGGTVTIYRSDGTPLKKEMKIPIFNGVVTEGAIDIGDPFIGTDITYNGKTFIPSEKGLLFLRVDTPVEVDGETVHFRYLDVCDFSIPYWQSGDESLELEMNLANNTINPDTFDWTIKRGIEKNNRVFIPISGVNF